MTSTFTTPVYRTVVTTVYKASVVTTEVESTYYSYESGEFQSKMEHGGGGFFCAIADFDLVPVTGSTTTEVVETKTVP